MAPPDSSCPLKIAFTYDSRAEWMAMGYSAIECAEFDTESTIEGIANALAKRGTVERIGGIQALTKVLANSKPGWDIVFNICEGIGYTGREAQVPALLEAWGIPFTFSDSATLALCLDKAKTKMILEHHGIPTAPFTCIPPRETWEDGVYPLSNIWNSPHGRALRTFPLFAKPAAEGTGMGITRASKVTNEVELAQTIEELSQRYPSQTILIERFLAGREVTVGIIGTGVDATIVGVREIVFLKNSPDYPLDPTKQWDSCDPALFDLDFYGYDLKAATYANPQYVDLDLKDPVAKQAASVALKAWKALGCRDGGRVDFRYDTMAKDAVQINPLAGLCPGFSDYPLLAQANGIQYDQLIAMIIDSALKRRKPLRKRAE